MASSDYVVRITRTYDELRDVIAKIGTKCQKIVAYEHTGSRVHCHLLLVECKVSTDTLKNYVKEKLGVVDKSDWSFKKCTEFYDKYITYMSKGTLQWKYQEGFEEEFLEKKKSEWVVKNEVHVLPSNKKNNKKDYWEIIMEVRSQLTFHNTSGIWESRYPVQSNSEIYDMLIKKLEENKIRAADYELKRWFHTIIREYDQNLKKKILDTLV